MPKQNIYDNETFFEGYKQIREKMLEVARKENSDPKITYIKRKSHKLRC